MPAPPTTNRRLTVVALLMAVFLAAVEATVVATAMPTVIADLGGITLYGWVGAVYLLASTVTMPLYGRLADLYGRKPVMLAGIAAFLVGSAGSGAATSMAMLVIARAVQGLGAGAIQPIAITVVGDLFTLKERGRVQGAFAALWGVAGIAGPLVGGLIVHVWSWRWVFWINLPIGLAAGLMLTVWFKEEQRTGKRPTLDIAGAVTLIAATVALLLATSDISAAVTFPLGLVLFVIFGVVERRAPSPLLPLDLLARRDVAIASLASALLGAAMVGTVSYLPLYAQGVLGAPPTAAGSLLAPMLVGWPIAAAVTSRLITRIRFRGPVWVGSVLGAFSLLLITFATGRGHGGVWLFAAMFLMGSGLGLTLTALLLALQSSVGWQERGVITAMNMFSRTIGGALGVSALGTALAKVLSLHMDPERVRALLSPEARRAGVTLVDAAAAQALQAGLRPVFWSMAILGLANLVVVAFYPDPPAITTSIPPPAPSEPSTDGAGI